MIKVGITGGIGSGKTLICTVFQRLGIPVYNADDAAKRLINSDKAIRIFITDRFGRDLFTKNGLNKKKLGSIVFSDPSALNELNSVIHPAVKIDFEQWLQTKEKAPYIIKESAILFESGAYKDLDKIIAVAAPKKLRIERVMQRDAVSETEIEKRIHFQSSDKDKIFKSDFVIYNDGKTLVLPQIIKIHKVLSELPG